MIITNYTLIPTPKEKEAIDWLQTNFPGKLEQFISKYLNERYVNMSYQEDQVIVKHMTETEKKNIMKRVK